MASWSWRAGRAREPQSPPAPRRPAVVPALIPEQTRPGLPEAVDRDEPGPTLPPAAGTATDPSLDAQLRRTLALVELSRLVIDAR